jgi:DNA primase small subunit
MEDAKPNNPGDVEMRDGDLEFDIDMLGQFF